MNHSAHYEVRKAEGVEAGWYWVLVAGNGEVVSVSETYTRRADAERAVKDVRRVADQADDNAGDDG